MLYACAKVGTHVVEKAPSHSHRQIRSISEGDIDFLKADACGAVERELPALAVVQDPLHDLGNREREKMLKESEFSRGKDIATQHQKKHAQRI